MTLFDDAHRDPDIGANANEGAYQYLNRSGRREAEHVREKFSEFFDRYPEAHQASLIARFRSDDDTAHQSAAFELILHEALLRSGARIEAIEPPLPHTNRSPDFLVRNTHGERFYLEATLATGVADADRRAKRRYDDFIQAINDVRTTEYLLSVRLIGTPSAPVNRRRVRASIEGWLNSLNFDDVASKGDAVLSGKPWHTHSETACTAELWPIPLKDPGTPVERAIGIHWGEGWVRSPGAALRSSLERKANRYGDLDLPYVVAVNGLDYNGQRHDVLAALFGQELARFPLGPDAGEAYWDRDWNGLWIRPDRQWRGQRVSGVLICDNLSLWSASRRPAIYVGHPKPRNPLNHFPLAVTKLLPVGGNLLETEGNTVGHILGLSNDWPD